MVRQRQINCTLVAYMAAFSAILMPNTLLAVDCIYSKFGFGVCIDAYSRPSSGVVINFASTDRPELVEQPHPRLHGAPLDWRRRAAVVGLLYLNEPVADYDTSGARTPNREASPSKTKARPHREARSPKGAKILETGYGLLKDIGREEPGYGLYSYAIVINNDNRSKMFLANVFNAIQSVKYIAAQRSRTNIFYVPLKSDKDELVSEGTISSDFQTVEVGGYYARNLYDYKFARKILDHLCDQPVKEIEAVCEGDLSRGPFIFAYARPASKVTPVPPPFLFIDLSEVHERAFPEFIAAFRVQVKRKDISDRAKIDTLRLKLLSIVLTGADWVAPVQKAIADIVHSASGQSEKDKK